MAVNGDISDLFFNRDLDACKIHDALIFKGWDQERLRDEAVTFLQNLNRLGVPTPTVDELLADFHGRC